MLSKQKKGEKTRQNEIIVEQKKEQEAEMERLRQIRQQEQNELHIKSEVEKRVQAEVRYTQTPFFGWSGLLNKICPPKFFRTTSFIDFKE